MLGCKNRKQGQSSSATLQLTIGGIAAELLDAGEVSPGVRFLKVRVPIGVHVGNAVPVVVQVGGVSSQAGARCGCRRTKNVCDAAVHSFVDLDTSGKFARYLA
jgi:hypothetical protein